MEINQALAARLYKAVKESQAVLSDHVTPGGTIVIEKDAISKLLGIIDDAKLVKAMNEYAAEVEREELQEPESIQWPESKSIDCTQYDFAQRHLHVIYKNGRTYLYTGVPASVWNDLKVTVSIGKFMNDNIKGQYQFVEL